MIKIIKVREASMAPTFAAGDYLICTKARALRPGFVVIADHARYGRIVKRVKSVDVKTVRLAGDSAESTASEDLGDVPISHITHRARRVVTPGRMKLKRL